MKEIGITFPCGELTLEGRLHLPEGARPFPAVVVCHPHPLFGGDMNNNVVSAVCEALPERGIAALRFNTRGTGRSQGSFGGGVEEREDVKAALSFVVSRQEVDAKRVGICGYSFGAIISFSAALPDGVQAVVAISPPLTMASLDGLEGFARPKLLVSGGRDSFISEEAFHGFCQSLPAPKECEVVPEADHFWWGSEEQLAQRVASFFAGVFAV